MPESQALGLADYVRNGRNSAFPRMLTATSNLVVFEPAVRLAGMGQAQGPKKQKLSAQRSAFFIVFCRPWPEKLAGKLSGKAMLGRMACTRHTCLVGPDGHAEAGAPPVPLLPLWLFWPASAPAS